MDYTAIYSIIIVAGVLGLTALITYLRKNNYVTKEDLQVVEQIFNLTTSIVDELNLKNEKNIMQISSVVVSALNYAIKISDINTDIVSTATEEAYLLCGELSIELTSNRKNIIDQLIKLGLQKRELL